MSEDLLDELYIVTASLKIEDGQVVFRFRPTRLDGDILAMTKETVDFIASWHPRVFAREVTAPPPPTDDGRERDKPK